MADLHRIHFLTQLWDLFATVCEGSDYLAQHPESAQMRSDLLAGLRALCAQLDKNLLPDAAEESEALQFASAKLAALAEGIKGGSAWNAVCVQSLEQAAERLAEGLSIQLSKVISGDVYLSREQAQPVFAFCAAAPRLRVAVYQLILELCEKAALSMPQQSFDWTIRALEEHPELLSGEDMAHPGYRYRASPQRTFARCPICGGAGTPYYRAFAYRMRHFTHPHMPAKLWMKCSGCGNLYTWQYPEELLTQADQPAQVQPDISRALTAIRPTSGSVLSIWSTILNKLRAYASGKDLLEVGIGDGCLLAVALEMGYRPDAVEIVRQSAQEVADVLQISVWNGDFLDYHPEKKYSIVIMGDVIEHVTDPERALRNAYRLLADDGALWLSTPNFEGSFTRMMKFNDPMWMEPYHITYFSYTFPIAACVRWPKPAALSCGSIR